MVQIVYLDETQLRLKLSRYGCELVRAWGDGTEIWRTGWDWIFTLTPELNNETKNYECVMVDRQIAKFVVPADFLDAIRH